jgi:hypothetical protein
MGRSKQISSAILRLWRSGTGSVSVNGGELTRLNAEPEVMGSAPPLHSGDSDKLNVGSEWSRNTSIEIHGRSPVPINIQAITVEFEIGKG